MSADTVTMHTVKKAIRGDEQAFIELIEAGKNKLYRLAFSYTRQEDDALDVVGETVYKAFTSISGLKYPQYFNTWLTRILINCAIDHLKKTGKTLSRTKGAEIESPVRQAEDSGAFLREDVLDLYQALDQLDQKHKTVIILKYFEDLTLEEIARVLQWPAGTVKTYLYRALKMLNLKLKEGEMNG